MAKVERVALDPMTEVHLHDTKVDVMNWFFQFQAKLEDFFLKKGFALVVIGFLLGRALILSQLSPFGLPFFAAVYLMRRDRAPLAILGLIGGALTVSIPISVTLFFSAFLF